MHSCLQAAAAAHLSLCFDLLRVACSCVARISGVVSLSDLHAHAKTRSAMRVGVMVLMRVVVAVRVQSTGKRASGSLMVSLLHHSTRTCQLEQDAHVCICVYAQAEIVSLLTKAGHQNRIIKQNQEQVRSDKQLVSKCIWIHSVSSGDVCVCVYSSSCRRRRARPEWESTQPRPRPRVEMEASPSSSPSRQSPHTGGIHGSLNRFSSHVYIYVCM